MEKEADWTETKKALVLLKIGGKVGLHICKSECKVASENQIVNLIKNIFQLRYILRENNGI